MKVGRNDECHCGSGKKYKKCCFAADQATEQSKTAKLLPRSSDPRDSPNVGWIGAETDGSGTVKRPAASDPIPKSGNPKMEAIKARWKEFNEATENVRQELYIKTLDEPDLMDDEMAFGMLNQLYQSTLKSDERDVWDNLVEQLRQRLPDVYVVSRKYYLGWQITNIIASGRLERATGLAQEIAEVAGDDVDNYVEIVDQLAYHGMLAELSQISHMAWPNIKASNNIMWGKNKFAEWGADCVLFEQLETTGELSLEDSELMQKIGYYFEDLQPEHFSEYIKSISGRSDRTFSLGDFKVKSDLRPQDGYDKDDKPSLTSDSQSALSCLLDVFVDYARRVEGVPYTKAKLACTNIYSYIYRRSAGKLEPQQGLADAMFSPRKQPQPQKQKPPANILCPDRDTLDRYITDQFHFMNPQSYPAVATFELMPTWLRFLKGKGLLESELHATTLKELGKLQTSLCNLYKSDRSDPALFANLSGWNGAAESTTAEVE